MTTVNTQGLTVLGDTVAATERPVAGAQPVADTLQQLERNLEQAAHLARGAIGEQDAVGNHRPDRGGE